MIENDYEPRPPASLDDVVYQLEQHGGELERITGAIEDVSSTLNDDQTWLKAIASRLDFLAISAIIAIIGIIAILGTLRHWF